MTIQAKVEPLEYLSLDTVQAVLNAYTTLYGMGYRGGLDTTGTSARIAMSQPNQAPVSAAVGDVIVYRNTSPPQVVECMTLTALSAKYQVV